MPTMGEIRRDKGTGEKPVWIESQKRWRARYTDANGKRRSVYSTIPGRKGGRICAKRRDGKVALVQAGVDVGLASQKMDAYLTAWLKGRLNAKPRGQQKYRDTVRLHIIPFIGNVPVGKLRTPRIKMLYAELIDAGRSAATVRYTHAVLHSALADAVQQHVIPTNYADHVETPRAMKGDIHPFTPAQTETLLVGIAGDPMEVLIILALRTAMRLGELLGLRWSDVNAGTHMLQVQRELYRLDKRWLTDDPKAGKHRSISITDDTLDLLRTYRLERSEALLKIGHRVSDDDLVFLTDAGDPIDGRRVTERRFRPLLKRIGLPERRFHDLRHTAATLMLAAGVHVKVVSEMLGHADTTVTWNRYAHVLPTMQAEAAAALETLTRRAAR